MRRGERLIPIIVIIIVLLGMGSPAGAEDEQVPDRFMLRLGGYHVSNAETIVRLDANDLPFGTYIDFSDTLGGDTSTTVTRLDGRYRFNDRHGVVFSWYALRFKGSTVLLKDIEWNGQIYPTNTQVDSEINFDIYKLSYQYSLYHNEKVELGASFGLHIMKVEAGIEAKGINQSGSESVTAPLPVWGLFAEYNFTPRLSAYNYYQFFFVNFEDKLRGGLEDFLIGLEYRVFRNVGIGAAYNRFSLNAKMEGDNATLHLNTNWNGALFYGTVYF